MTADCSSETNACETKTETTFETLTNFAQPEIAQNMVKDTEAGQYLWREVKFDMSGPALHGGQDLGGGGSSDGMDLLYLVHLIGAGKQRKQAHHLHNRTGLWIYKVAMVQQVMIICEYVWRTPAAICLCLHAPICLSVSLSVCLSAFC